MGQVPYGLIGSGRLATHLKFYLTNLGFPPITWSRRDDETVSVETKLENCRTVLLAISDAAIEPFIRQHPRLITKRLVHLSGSLVTALAPSAHPLASFTTALFSPEVYTKIPMIWEQGPFKYDEFFPELPNPFFEVSPTLKPLYHAFCVLVGNFSTLLWQEGRALVERDLALPDSFLFQYLQTLQINFEKNPDAALTGPLVRGDYETLRRDLESIPPGQARDIFRAFIEIYSPRALRTNTPTTRTPEVSP